MSSARHNSSLYVEIHESGGHVGFVSGQNPFRADYYAESRVADFLAGLVSRGAPAAPTGDRRKVSIGAANTRDARDA
jgi:hypothetical protein